MDELGQRVLELRDPNCPFCPIDLKKIIELSDVTLGTFRNSGEKVAILYWLNGIKL